jgi:hypothetical protein
MYLINQKGRTMDIRNIKLLDLGLDSKNLEYKDIVNLDSDKRDLINRIIAEDNVYNSLMERNIIRLKDPNLIKIKHYLLDRSFITEASEYYMDILYVLQYLLNKEN